MPDVTQSAKQFLHFRHGWPLGALWWIASVLFVVAVHSAHAQTATRQLLVKPRSGVSRDVFENRIRQAGGQHRRFLRRQDVRVVSVPFGNVESAAKILAADPLIEYAEVDGLARAAFVPNDSYIITGAEWHLEKITAPAAWDYTVGSSQVLVAVLDSGVNAAHPDLAGSTVAGFNFVAGTEDISDDFGHGTAVAGTIAATGNNNFGVAGVAYGCKLLPVKVVNSTGFAAYSDIADGIYYAIEKGARVINISIAGDTPSATLQAAVDFAWSNNVMIVAAAGNNADSTMQYPAACTHVVSVSATTSADALASFSSFGNWITLSAPGDNIWTTDRELGSPYGSWRGTSFASPIVASVAALLYSVNPSLSVQQTVAILATNADDLGASGFDTAFGSGRINAYNALSAATHAPGALVTTPEISPRPSSDPGSNQPAFSLTNLPAFSRYAGLVADPNRVSTANAGYVTVAVRGSGKLSGRLSVGGKRFGFTGFLNSSGHAALFVPRRFGTPMKVTLDIDQGTGADRLLASVAADGWLAEGLAERNVFQARTNPAPQFGRRAFRLEQTNDTQTAGIGIGNFSRGGNGHLRGTMNDGGRFVVSSTLSGAGNFPFYYSRNHGNEVLLGWVQFSSASASDAAGSVLWLNSATNGFARDLEVTSASLR